jgi:hypothetical protein
MGGVVALLPVGHEGQRLPCVKSALGQDGEQEHLHRRDGEPPELFFHLRHTRTRKKCARIQSVI